MKTYKIKPPKASFYAGAIAMGLFIIFGIVFLFILDKESWMGKLFLVFWLLICIGMFVYFIRAIRNYNKPDSDITIRIDETESD